MGARSPIRA